MNVGTELTIPSEGFFNKMIIIKNVSSSTSHKKLRLSIICLYGNLKKKSSYHILYESILIKIYMNANIMNTQIL